MMSESASSAGEILRSARLAQGLDLDALASMIKVSPAKLDALENGRHELLPDANFTRALAMTVCRSLKIDPAPVLAALPAAQAIPLAPSKPALNQPFKESRGANLSFDSGGVFDVRSLLKPQWLAPILLLLASVAVYMVPDSVIHWPHWAVHPAKPAAEVASAPEASPAASAVAATSSSAPDIAASQAEVPAAVAASAPSAEALVSDAQPAALPEVAAPASPDVADSAAASSGSGPLVLSSREPAWVEIKDKHSVLLSRHLKEGERVELNGTPPFKLRLGNSQAVDVTYQGQPVELASHTRNNVARLVLK